ncbi:MAG: MATE family efflux transporter [Treponema sp.]|nr:MATE family efflux transporter [Treponema sp.]
MTLKKSHNVDMLNGNLILNLIKFTLPLAFTGILQQLFNAADVAVVGQFAGKEAMAAVGSNSPVIGLLVGMFLGLSLGTNVVIAYSVGQNNVMRIQKAVHTSIVVSVFGGIVLAALGEFLAQPVVSLMGVPEEVSEMALLYLRIYLLGLPVIFLYNFESAIFRSRGNTKLPLISLIVSGIINVLLNLAFVVIFDMGVAGVAWATVISNVVSSLLLLIFLVKTEDKIKVSFKNLCVDASVLGKILKVGVPSGIQSMVFSLSNIIIQSAINSLGTTVMAASSAAFNLEVFAFYILNSYGQSCTTFVGQNFGAGKHERCTKVLKDCLLLNFSSTAAMCTLILIFGKYFLSIFNTDPDVISVGMIRLEYIFFAYVFSFAQEVLSGYLRGFGISTIPAVASVIGICGTRLIWIFTIFKRIPTFGVIMQVYPVSLGITALVMIAFTLIIRPSKRYAGKVDI